MMPEITPDDQEPVVRGTYDATAGAFASLDRAARREEAVMRTLASARFQHAALDQLATDLIEELHEIDRS